MLLKLSLLTTALFLACLMWQCGSGLIAGARLSDDAVRRFHSQLDSGAYDEIVKGADDEFQNSVDRKEVLNFFAGVHSKLGASHDATRRNISVSLTAKGTFIKVAYESTFQQGNAIETFTWRQAAADGRLLLYGYNIQSNVFLSNDAPSRSPKNSLKRF